MKVKTVLLTVTYKELKYVSYPESKLYNYPTRMSMEGYYDLPVKKGLDVI